MAWQRPSLENDADVIADIDKEIAAAPTEGMRSNLEEHRYHPSVHRALWDEYAATVSPCSELRSVTETIEVSAESVEEIEDRLRLLGWTANNTGTSWDRDELHIEFRRSMRQGDISRQGGYQMPGRVLAVWRDNELIDPNHLLGE